MTPTGAAVLQRYRPRRLDPDVWAALRPTVVGLVERADPADSIITRVAGATAHFLVWAMLEGHRADSDDLWQDRWIEQHVRQFPVVDKSTLRSDLRRVARGGPYVRLEPVRIRKRLIAAPYAVNQQATLWRLVDAQATANRRLRLGVFVCCGFGAGLSAVEQRFAAPQWVNRHGDTTVVTVPDGVHPNIRPRIVPMREPWGTRLTGLLADWPYDHLVTGDGSPQTVTVLTKLWERCTGKDEAPVLTAGRMATTYRAALVASGVPLWVMYEIGGITRNVYDGLVDLLADPDGRVPLGGPDRDVASIVDAWTRVIS